MASMRPEEPNECVFSKRRAVLLLGISILPFYQFRARALEGVASTLLNKQGLQRESPSNPFLSLLNGLGIFGTGVLGPLYALAQNDKKDTDATIESVSLA
ncbi:hypothetical protein Dsin_013703 [Dipteronia sinensis]|uniref:Uncharacterized protein n=1 Tax=Dipteronia sinensis TaxID=43782 RepID=A0AAE0AKG6_9ROSI|nr:hypothetical protein Dsin_013703 [Dipteronia sinensis]